MAGNDDGEEDRSQIMKVLMYLLIKGLFRNLEGFEVWKLHG